MANWNGTERKRGGLAMPGRRPDYEPTLAEIRAKCAEIQTRWTERERQKRAAGWEDPNWMPPMVEMQAWLPDDPGSRQGAF